jgi:hypothetical protein
MPAEVGGMRREVRKVRSAQPGEPPKAASLYCSTALLFYCSRPQLAAVVR